MESLSSVCPAACGLFAFVVVYLCIRGFFQPPVDNQDNNLVGWIETEGEYHD